MDGDHRVGIFAAQDLPAGTEIFYDYGYYEDADGHCPQWGEKAGKRRKASHPTRQP